MFFRGQTIGKYRIVSALGSGGFGSVYLAEDTWIDKKVALKVPHKQGLDFSELLKEPRLLASMSHPNIVTVLTAEKQEDVFFIVMEYVQGETLEEKILREGALELPVALDLTCQICNAVDHAHRAGILHRDLRPGNMLLSDTGLLKVTDFGTSRFLEIAVHGTTIIGSPPYMAPEQFHGKAVFASDVYSIGVTMYQMLTGTLPYATPSPADLERLMTGELVVVAAAAQPQDPEGPQRYRPQGAGPRTHRALQPALGGTSTTSSPHGRRCNAPGGRSRGATTRWPTSSRVSAPATPRSPVSAGIAESHSRPGRRSARSAAKPSRGLYAALRPERYNRIGERS